MHATITAIINQKGGTGKTCTCASLGIGLAREGKNVLLVDFDPQSSLTISLGYDKPDDLPVTVATLMMKAMKRTHGRPSLRNVSQFETQKRTDQLMAEQTGESRATIQRYIRLTQLLPELLDMVDNRKLGMNPAVEISFLTKEEQADLLDAIESEQALPTLAQAQRMKKFSYAKRLTVDVKQTVKELAAQNQGMTSIEVHDKHIKAFDRVARKYGIDYAVKKVPGCPPRHLIFFKARDQDALDAAFAEFLHKQQVREKRPSIRKLLKSIIDKMPKRDPTRKKDREQTL